jgi:tetratricopeptide (TPR) repeat protein
MALQNAGVNVLPESISPELFLPGRHGSLQIEMISAARRHGTIAYRLAPDLKDVLREVSAGLPVIVLQNLAYNWYPVWHYAVVIGYDLDQGELILRSGSELRQALSMRTFEYTWARSEYWAMVTVPPGRIPATAKEADFVGAVSIGETYLRPEQAQDAYRAALQRWPGNLIAEIGVGNAAYRQEDYAKAEQAFRQATDDHPESVAALNNLAQTLLALNRFQEARQMAQRAADLGGELSPVARKTLHEIEERAPVN